MGAVELRLLTLKPENGWEFLTAMSTAWHWTQKRKRFYCDTGGNQGLTEFLADAQDPHRKQIGVLSDGALCAIITVKAVFSKGYEIHVTTQRGTSAGIILDALQEIRDSLFNELGAGEIVTSCPVYGRHEHKGSRRLAEACGMRATGIEWNCSRDPSVLWREYSINREKYYGKR